MWDDFSAFLLKKGENVGKTSHALRKQESLEVTSFSKEIIFPRTLFIYKEVARLHGLLCPAWDARGTSVKAEGGGLLFKTGHLFTALCSNMLVIITVHYH